MTASQVVRPAPMAATISLAVHSFKGFEAVDFMIAPYRAAHRPHKPDWTRAPSPIARRKAAAKPIGCRLQT